MIQSPDAFDAHLAEDRLPWPDGWDQSRDPADMLRCRMMWCAVLSVCIHAVLTQALRERPPTRDERHRSSRLRQRDLPDGWIGSRDFHMICALAGFDGVAMAERLRVALATPEGCQAMIDRLHSGQGRWGARDAE